MSVFVISKNSERLMPTNRLGKVRHMLKDGRAIIYQRNPFTIQLTYETTEYVQPVELCQDTGYQHIGTSVKSESEEYVAAQHDLLLSEKGNHDDCRKYRRDRRNRKRYRAPRFDNRRAAKKPGWIAPSLRNKADRHIDIIRRYIAVAPITSVTIEIGQFDPQVLKAVAEGKPIPTGSAYQHGPMYGIDTLREAVFQRDKHTCIFCGRGLKQGAVLHTHHVYFWRDQHGDSLDELATCCEKCHTPKNHKKGGKLWGYDKKLPRYSGAAFMNTVRWYIYNQLQEYFPDTEIHITYGAATKRARLDLGLDKSHVNDAFAMGKLHPGKRAKAQLFVKRRRNNRCLEKFYDAKYIDVRDGKVKTGAELGCQRINRRELRISDKSQRIYRGKKKSSGRRSVRKQRYSIRPGDVLICNNRKTTAEGVHCNGTRVTIERQSYSIKKITLQYHKGGWIKTTINGKISKTTTSNYERRHGDSSLH